jgi:hypothetical protein
VHYLQKGRKVYKFIYIEEQTGRQVTISVPEEDDRDLTVDELLEEFHLFLKGVGYCFNVNDTLCVDKQEPEAKCCGKCAGQGVSNDKSSKSYGSNFPVI